MIYPNKTPLPATETQLCASHHRVQPMKDRTDASIHFTRSSLDRLNVEIGNGESVLLDEVAARLDEVAHQGRKCFFGDIFVVNLDQQQRAHLGVERRFPELIGVHLAKAFVARHLNAAAA